MRRLQFFLFLGKKFVEKVVFFFFLSPPKKNKNHLNTCLQYVCEFLIEKKQKIKLE